MPRCRLFEDHFEHKWSHRLNTINILYKELITFNNFSETSKLMDRDFYYQTKLSVVQGRGCAGASHRPTPYFSATDKIALAGEHIFFYLLPAAGKSRLEVSRFQQSYRGWHHRTPSGLRTFSSCYFGLCPTWSTPPLSKMWMRYWLSRHYRFLILHIQLF